MKTLKKINFAILAVVLGLGLVFTQSAFKAPAQKTVNTYWHFMSSDIADARDYTAYEKIVDFDEEEICDNGTSLPCVLELSPSVVTPGDLNTYLSNAVAFPNDAAVTSSTPYKKN